MKIKDIKNKTGIILANKLANVLMQLDDAEKTLTDNLENADSVLELDESDYFKRYIEGSFKQGQVRTIIGCTIDDVLFEDGSQIGWGNMSDWEAYSVLDGFSFIFEKDKYKDSPFFQGGK